MRNRTLAALLALLPLLALSGCADPYFGAGIEVNGSGMSVSPRAGGRIGGLTVGIEG